MHDNISALVKALRSSAKAIEGSTTADTTLQDVIGWTAPGFNRHDLGAMARLLADRLEEAPDSSVNSKYDTTRLVKRLESLQTTAIPNLWNGNGLTSYNVISAELSQIERLFAKPMSRIDWEEAARDELMPKELARRLRSIRTQIGKLDTSTETLADKMAYIEQAHEAAIALPTDLESVRDAETELVALRDSAAKAEAAVTTANQQADTLLRRIEEREKEATKLIENIGSAYSAATSQGLAAAFGERANSLQTTTWIWVVLLTSALTTGGAIGFFRLRYLQTLVATPNVAPAALWVSGAMSFLAIAAPLWFAWLATKQIAQRFRLSEDYAFKASVARAYEGYRREAARLDPQLESRLFASALDRLEEQPLRFISTEEHSSPYLEIISSPSFQRALEKFPDLRQSIMGLLRKPEAGSVEPGAVS